MKTYVHFDAGGFIHGIVNLDAPEGVTVMMEPEPGRSVAEIDAPELASAGVGSAGDNFEKVREFASKHRIDTTSPQRGKLAKY
ncbi:MAG: hypothetical protein KIT09_30375 [Bryobacteraceae bacterium]|nr:hypothetical protein [Bryobacteraceae bacterium]